MSQIGLTTWTGSTACSPITVTTGNLGNQLHERKAGRGGNEILRRSFELLHLGGGVYVC
jgi:hypothetical protein